MISKDDYFKAYAGHKDITAAREINAEMLLERVNALLAEAQADGVTLDINPATGTLVGGEKNGGFRPQDCPIGASGSAHKQGQAVDIYDRDGDIDAWLMAHPSKLVDHDLYMEHPDDTRTAAGRAMHSEGWCHLQTRRTGSGNRIFHP